jgi:type IV pilus assembly protein PilM
MAEKKSVLTLNLGSQRVGMARFGIGGKGSLLLKEYAFAELSGDPTTDGTRRFALTDAVKSLGTALRATDGPVTYAVPGQFLICKFVKLPNLAEDQVDKIVGFEAQQAVPFPLNETVWDYQLMGKTGGEMEVGIVAIRSEHLNDLNAAVEGNGLVAQVVDAAPVALYNAFRYNYPENDGCALLIDLGARTTNLIFIEGRRAFISSFQTGGASISQSIAKEMGMEYDVAEQRKVTDGFVNLGGNYEDHEDPEIDSMSKVIRNALARIHGEIVRRTNAYRQQQGGSAPSIAYLAGAGASLPYVKEVIEEKLRVPVEYFNPLKNVSVGPKVDVERVAGEAHTLGELVGLALRQMACPMELDLAPKSVQAKRDVGNRKPFLYAAAAALVATLLAVWAYNSRAAAGYEKETVKLNQKISPLLSADSAIKKEENREKDFADRAQIMANAISDQKYWVNMFDTLNNLLKDNQIWIVQLTPCGPDGRPVSSGKLFDNDVSWPFDDKGGPSTAAGAKDKAVVTDLLVVAINRNPDGNHAIDFFKSITKDSNAQKFFDFSASKSEDDLLRNHLKNDVGDLLTKDGYAFTMRLPLKRQVEVPVIKSARP